MPKQKARPASIEAEAREWAKAQRHKQGKVSPLDAYFASRPDAWRFIVIVREETGKGATASWDAITAHLVAKYGLPRGSQPGTLAHYYYRKVGNA